MNNEVLYLIFPSPNKAERHFVTKRVNPIELYNLSSNFNNRDTIMVHLQSQISDYLNREQLYMSMAEFSYVGKKVYKTYLQYVNLQFISLAAR